MHPQPSISCDALVENHDLSSLCDLSSVGEPISPEAGNGTTNMSLSGSARLWILSRKLYICCEVHWCWMLASKRRLGWSLFHRSLALSRPSPAPWLPSSVLSLPFLIPLQANSWKVMTFEVLLSLRRCGHLLPVLSTKIINATLTPTWMYVSPFWLWFGLTLWKPFSGTFYTGDGAARDEHGYICIKGSWRLVISAFSLLLVLIPFKDVINVSGHHLSTAETELVLIMHKGVAETAGAFQNIIPCWCSTSHPIVIGTADELTGQAVDAFIPLKLWVLTSRQRSCIWSQQRVRLNQGACAASAQGNWTFRGSKEGLYREQPAQGAFQKGACCLKAH